MHTRKMWIVLAVVPALFLLACGGKNAAAPTSSSNDATTHTMADGTKMSDAEMAQADKPPAPSDTAKMICSSEIKNSIKAQLKLSTTPKPASRYTDKIYTCTYQLSVGTLTLTVNDANNAKSGRAYFDKLQASLPTAANLKGALGLGLPAFQTPNGNVVFLKDGKTLRVDATKLPATFAPDKTHRLGLAYALATTVIACWQHG